MKPWVERVDLLQDASAVGVADRDFTGEPYRQSVPCDLVSVAGAETYKGFQVEKYTEFVVEMIADYDITTALRVEVMTGAYTGEILKVRSVKQVPYRNGNPPETWLMCRRSTSAEGED